MPLYKPASSALVSLGLPPTVIQKLLRRQVAHRLLEILPQLASCNWRTMAYNKDLSKWRVFIKRGKYRRYIWKLIKINNSIWVWGPNTGLFNILMEGRRVLGMYAAADKLRQKPQQWESWWRVTWRRIKYFRVARSYEYDKEEAQSKADILIERPEFSEPIKIWIKYERMSLK